jgi:hypothetical protein
MSLNSDMNTHLVISFSFVMVQLGYQYTNKKVSRTASLHSEGTITKGLKKASRHLQVKCHSGRRREFFAV